MDEYTIRQAIDLIKARRLMDARKLLKPVLEVNPNNEAAWIWFSSTFDRISEQLEVMRNAAEFCADSQPILRGIQRLEHDLMEKQTRGEEIEPVDIARYMPALRYQRSESTGSFSTSVWDTPFQKSWSHKDQPGGEPAESDWIASLRSAVSTDQAPEVSPIVKKISHEEQESMSMPWELEAEETSPAPQPPFVSKPFATDGLIPTVPASRPVLWNGQDIGLESVETSPFFSEMEAPVEVVEEDSSHPHREQQSGDPYRIPFYLAGAVGVVLFILVVIFLVVVIMMNLA